MTNSFIYTVKREIDDQRNLCYASYKEKRLF